MLRRRTLAEVDISPYEGLVVATSRRYCDLLPDMDVEDVQQVLRLKVAQALVVFDPAKWNKHSDERDAERGFVFGAVANMVRDLMKSQVRRNNARGGMQLYIEDVASGDGDSFERRHLMKSDEEVFHAILEEAPKLPSDLTPLEHSVIFLLHLNLNQTEIARELGVSRQKVRTAHLSVKVKLRGILPLELLAALELELKAPLVEAA